MDTLKELYSIFRDELSLECQNILVQYNNSNFDLMKRTVHNVKGISSNYKAVNIFTKASMLNSILAEKRYDEIKEKLDELKSAVDESIREIDDFFEKGAK